MENQNLLVLPTPEIQQKLLKFFNENPKTRNCALKTIKDWLRRQPHLPNEWEKEDARLLNFLRHSKFCIETCKKRLDVYFTLRTAYPEFFTNRDVTRPELQKLPEIGYAAVMPDLTPEGKRVSIVKLVKQDFETPNMADVFKLVFMAGDVRLELEKFGSFTDVYILDMGFPLHKHFFKVSPFLIRKFLICVQEAYPVMVTEIHFTNAPPFLEFVINFCRPFFNEELRNSIKVHSGVDTLYEYVPKDILPEDFGGKLKKMEDFTKDWMQVLEEYGCWFKEQEDVKCDESKRPRRWFSWSNFFGFDAVAGQSESIDYNGIN